MRSSPFSVYPRSSAAQTCSLPGQRAAPWAKAFFGKEKQNFEGKNMQQLGLNLWFFLSKNEHVILCYLLEKPSPLSLWRPRCHPSLDVGSILILGAQWLELF